MSCPANARHNVDYIKARFAAVIFCLLDAKPLNCLARDHGAADQGQALRVAAPEKITSREGRMKMKSMGCAAALSVVALSMVVLGGSLEQARAESPAEFYKGKSLSMVVQTTTGNDYDNRGRLFARYMGDLLPGKPGIIVRNMPGGGGVVASNWLAKVAPRDGTVLSMLMQTASMNQALGMGQIQYDVRELGWIGNTSDTPSVVTVWHTAGAKTIEDAKTREIVLGGTVGTASVIYPNVLNELVGTKFKVVTGYPGGNQINLAMESGEVQGRGSNSWSSWKSTRPEWIAENKIFNLVQIALKRAPDLQDVPLMMELARDDFNRSVLRFLSADTAIARAMVTTPGVPADRLAALRAAFDAAMKLPALIEEANKMQLDLAWLSGADSQKIAASIIETDPKVVARARDIVGSHAK
jgi:tripartite-type tricarboxylate transporter receptor subunit TctC